MKRLIVPFVMCAAMLMPSTVFAQSKDLAGSWTLDVEKSGKKDGPPMVVIELTDKEFTAKMGNEKAKPLTFKLDGSETATPDGYKTKAGWKGNKLDATLINPRGEGETISFSRDGAWLVMEGQSKEHGPMKFFFKKTTPKLVTTGGTAILLRTRPDRP